MSFIAAAVIGGGATLLGGYLSGEASKNAAATQAGAAREANGLQQYMYDQTRQDQEPWRNAGRDALGRLGVQREDFNRDFSAGDFVQDPGYQFRLAEGQKAIERSASARGGLNSTGTMKNLARYSQDFASNEYGNAYNRFNSDRDRRFNRLASLAGIGQTANGQVANAGQNYANQTGQNIIGAGNAQAAGQVGQANAYNQAIGNGTNAWMQYQMINRAFPAQTPA